MGQTRPKKTNTGNGEKFQAADAIRRRKTRASSTFAKQEQKQLKQDWDKEKENRAQYHSKFQRIVWGLGEEARSTATASEERGIVLINGKTDLETLSWREGEGGGGGGLPKEKSPRFWTRGKRGKDSDLRECEIHWCTARGTTHGTFGSIRVEREDKWIAERLMSASLKKMGGGMVLYLAGETSRRKKWRGRGKKKSRSVQQEKAKTCI